MRASVQEEAPSRDKPVLVTRTSSERVEAEKAGTMRFAGTGEERALTDDPARYRAMADAPNPYGDGHAALAGSL